MLVIVIIVFVTIATIAWMTYRAVSTKEWKIQVDGLANSFLSSLLIVAFGFVFREQLYNFFQRPKVVLEAHSCPKIPTNGRNNLYDCKITLKNSSEQSLQGYRFILASSATYSNFNFDSCVPKFLSAEDAQTMTVETNTEGAANCGYKIALNGYQRITFNVTINGGTNEPDPEILQK